MNHKRLITALALLILVVSVHAQSGRRQTKPVTAAPVPTPTPEPTPTPKKEDKPAELIFLVGKDIRTGGDFTGIPLHFHSSAQRGCAERLRSRASAEVDAPEREMSRSEAIDKAKKSVNTYVVLLTLGYDSMAARYGELQLDFVLFAPQTAKVMLTGRSYVNSTRTGPVVIGPTSRLPSGVYRESWLLQAGEEAADKVLKRMNLGSLPK